MVKMTLNDLTRELTAEEQEAYQTQTAQAATLKKAKQYGKGYTGFLSRLIDAAIDDEELVRRCI